MNLESQIQRANLAARKLAMLSAEEKNKALKRISELVLAERDLILAENAKDMEEGEKNNLGSKLDRLLLTEDRLRGISDDTLNVASLPDSVGQVIDETERPNGLKISRVRVPIGVIGIIYEARPNVTVDAAVLCLKSGNAVILKGGSDAINSNRILAKLIRQALEETGLDPEAVQFIDSTDRETTVELLKTKEGIDCIIPRGGKGLIDFVKETSSIPVIETGASVVHVYVDKAVDIQKAVDITVNAKTRRVSICNTLDVLLVHKDIASEFLPQLADALTKRAEEEGQELVEIHADEQIQNLLNPYSLILNAADKDFDTEFLDYKMSIKTVGSLDEALDHIAEHSLKHSESIVTEDKEAAEKFLKSVDAACVYHNASTQFSDGAQFGLGAEIGISTQKLHVRGPFALEGLTTFKWVIRGDGQVRD
ncbi:glutamate-5-semialdehyde dehydrogenase [Patescibacteria group bacterium]|nr:glutamate-5-semialdehyde dehydrogenase [Patescibacteria group bacterium]MBU1683380.1 glutamate-5-semialdehyde dehydrogenase [Patescibacteria group bacterium]MBU1935536.1 glutamate-5-semialdehyde dehydrogenase [Patescibacteria group bacterium]